MKGPKYARNIVFFVDFFCRFLGNVKKTDWLFFSHWIFVESLESHWSLPASKIFNIFWVTQRKVMKTREASDFLWLHKNMNCALPLRVLFIWMDHSLFLNTSWDRIKKLQKSNLITKYIEVLRNVRTISLISETELNSVLWESTFRKRKVREGWST